MIVRLLSWEMSSTWVSTSRGRRGGAVWTLADFPFEYASKKWPAAATKLSKARDSRYFIKGHEQPLCTVMPPNLEKPPLLNNFFFCHDKTRNSKYWNFQLMTKCFCSILSHNRRAIFECVYRACCQVECDVSSLSFSLLNWLMRVTEESRIFFPEWNAIWYSRFPPFYSQSTTYLLRSWKACRAAAKRKLAK